MNTIMSVACILGGLGAVTRWGVDQWIRRVVEAYSSSRADKDSRKHGKAPTWIGIAVVNVVGCVLMGLLVACVSRIPHTELYAQATTLLGSGFLGGFTTFSSAVLDAGRLLMAGHWRQAGVACLLVWVTACGACACALALV